MPCSHYYWVGGGGSTQHISTWVVWVGGLKVWGLGSPGLLGLYGILGLGFRVDGLGFRQRLGVQGLRDTSPVIYLHGPFGHGTQNKKTTHYLGFLWNPASLPQGGGIESHKHQP